MRAQTNECGDEKSRSGRYVQQFTFSIYSNAEIKENQTKKTNTANGWVTDAD